MKVSFEIENLGDFSRLIVLCDKHRVGAVIAVVLILLLPSALFLGARALLH